jgi:hypothetical protein
MITPTHIVYNLAILGRKNKSEINRVIFFGGLLPDISTYLFYLYYSIIGASPFEIWDKIYFLPVWQNYFGLTHSLWLWPICFIISFYKKWRLATYFFSSVLLHVILDFCLHATDGYSHFVPFSDFKFYSPISYYDPKYFGDYVSIIELFGYITCSFILYKRTQNIFLKICIILLAFILTLARVSMEIFR